ncbi:MAG: [acyl-carrier-protein] S-malonyltransferase [Betaproteobacteria bacterium RIFCSPLOWO2_12_FULL_68_19]|nr:MAG: [acyl-carrier-protein] S-malonyltransferase [Betaproteobacteria bacterium RIFCSPLOWO2_12_FULL_68_19]
MKLAMVFPGQGSQAVGMLRGYEDVPEALEVLLEAQQVLGGEFIELLEEGPAEALNLTVNTQPAMLTAGYAAYRAWLARGGPRPEVLAGHSLGEYTALVAAGALAFRDALPLVRFRAEAMQDAVPEGEGAMAAILGLDDQGVRAACAEAQGAVQAVNFNAPGQVVIAGQKAAVERAILLCKSRGAKRAMPLPVSAPFHSSLMKPAGERLQAYLKDLRVAVPQVPVINNVDVRIESQPQAIKSALVRQAAAPVRWVETIRTMAQLGVTHVVECGPGKVLSALTRRIVPELHSIAAADRGSLDQAIAAVKGA